MLHMINKEVGTFLACLLPRSVYHGSVKDHGGLKDAVPVNKYGWATPLLHHF